MVHVRSEHDGMDEFGSELLRHSQPAPKSGSTVWSDWSRDEWTLRIVTAVAIVETVILIVAGVSLLGVFRSATGTIVIESRPASAEVRLDGAVAGTTPLTVDATAGRRSIEVRHGKTARTMTVDVVAGETTRSLVEFLTPPPPSVDATAEVRVTSEPVAAQVAIDGVARGATPLAIQGLAPGTHTVSVRGPNGQIRQSIIVAAGRPQSLHVLLSAPSALPGWMTVAVPTPLRVFDNGRFVGASGESPIALSAGAHQLEFVNDELGLRVPQRVVVQAGKTIAVTPQLPRGLLAINAQPWAEVWLNGERAGETPIGNLSRPVGQYEVVLRHPELGERNARVRVTSDTTTRLNVDMRQRANTP